MNSDTIFAVHLDCQAVVHQLVRMKISGVCVKKSDTDILSGRTQDGNAHNWKRLHLS
jgi:hypothetical protein